MINILLGIPSPRDIPQVLEQQDKLPIDKLIIKYYHEWTAYQHMRTQFLRLKEYTHLVIASDDLIVKPENVLKLINELEKKDYPVFGGVCSINGDDLNTINIIRVENMPTLNERHYEFIKRKTMSGINQVGYAGFPLMAIRRDLIERFDFDSQSKLEGGDPDYTGNLDLIFCLRCKENNIPIFVDTDNYMVHLRGHGQIKWHDSYVELWKKDGERTRVL
jgi:hypothetical protein